MFKESIDKSLDDVCVKCLKICRSLQSEVMYMYVLEKKKDMKAEDRLHPFPN